MATQLSTFRRSACHRRRAVVSERRQRSRPSVTLSAAMQDGGEQPEPQSGEGLVPAVLQDVSAYGCRVGCVAAPPAAGTRIWLRFAESGPVAATVVWSEAEAAGCRFDEPIEHHLRRALIGGTD